MSTTEDLRKLVNASGFLFQLRVEDEVKRTRRDHGWRVFAKEHPWLQVESGKSGYIDLILQKAGVRMVVECKRTQNATWVFLVPSELTRGELLRCLQVIQLDGGERQVRWQNSYVPPESYLSEYCIVRGTGEGQASMLERLSENLLESLESFAVEETLTLDQDSSSGQYFYVPTIVTNADLQVCVFSPQEVSLDQGTLDTSSFESVPFIRFHKSLATRLDRSLGPRTVHQANQERARTVFVISASYLSEFLKTIYFSEAW